MNSDIRAQLQATLGNAYTLERELGGGGMSRVFVATETALGRRVVVKVLSPELTAGVNVERFNREILLAARLQHPHIVPVLAAGETDGLPYYTMPFVEGESLRAHLARANRLSITEAVGTLRDVAKALAYAHERGIVHRDIKPDNVLLTGGSATVTDFGIAKAINASRTVAPGGTLTQVGTSIGTPAYMSPEQAAGDPATDHRTDIYSFGCLAYEVLAGRPPFAEASPRKLLAAHMGEAAEPVGALRPDTPADLAELVMRCLEKEADARPQRASDLVQVLEIVTSGGAQPAMPRVLLGGTGSLKKALAIYAVAVCAVAILAKAAIVGIGLPSWVFPGAMIVMALVLPVILWTGYVHRVARRAMTATPTFTPGGTPSLASGTMATLAIKASPHVSWKRTTSAGAWALGVFVLLVTAFMTLRALGIGPAGSLMAAGKIKAKEPILLTDFTVTNGDSALGRVASDALRAGLAESNVISLVPATIVAAALERMKRPANSRVDLALGRQIAAREGYKVIVDGEVTPLASSYVLVVRLATADSGTQLASYRETADGPKGLIDAVDNVARRLREKIGESLRKVQGEPPLAQVTTGSLEALRKYSEGNRANSIEQDWPKAVRLLRESVAIDSTFGSAWRLLGVAMGNVGLSPIHRDSALSRAYQYRDRMPLSERDRAIAAYFYNGPGRDRAKGALVYETMVARGDSFPLNNLALIYRDRREFARAESLFRAANRRSSALIVYDNLIDQLFAQGKLDAVDSLIAEERAQFPTSAVPRRHAITRLYYRGKFDALEHALDSARSVPDRSSPASTARFSAAYALLRGHVADWRRYRARAVAADSSVGISASDLATAVALAPIEALVLRQDQEGARALDAALAREPMRAMPEVERPYLGVARAYAVLGSADRARTVLDQYRSSVKDTARLREEQPMLHGVLAEIARAERGFASAIEEYRRSDLAPDGPVSRCTVCLPLFLSRAFDEAGIRDSAIAAYNAYLHTPWHARFTEGGDATYLPMVLERLGQLYGAKGDAKHALENYTQFVELWNNADPELQPRVAEARKRIAALGGK